MTDLSKKPSKNTAPSNDGKKTTKTILIVLVILAVMSILAYGVLNSGGTATSANDPSVTNGGDSPPSSVVYRQPEAPFLEEGTAAPDFTLSTLEGKAYTLSSYKNKQPVLVEFFSPLCPHCQDSTTPMKEIVSAFDGKLVILAINAADSPEHPAPSGPFIKEYGITYPILEKPERAFLNSYKLNAFPTFYLVDKDGNIAWSHIGTLHADTVEDLKAAINKTL